MHDLLSEMKTKMNDLRIKLSKLPSWPSDEQPRDVPKAPPLKRIYHPTTIIATHILNFHADLYHLFSPKIEKIPLGLPIPKDCAQKLVGLPHHFLQFNVSRKRHALMA